MVAQSSFSRVMRWLMPLLILAAAFYGVRYLNTHKPEPDKGRPPQAPVVEVDATTLERQDYLVRLRSWGVVKPRTESQLVAQVGGEIVELSERMREGAFFEKGDLLLRIDDRDYQAQLEIAHAQLAEAEVRLTEEQARSAQAARDWRRLGRGDPTELVLRKPQLAAAEAAIASARARVATAELSLARTRIVAPYAGRILRKQVDVGQVVGSGSKLADIFAVDYVEVRLPLNSQQLGFIELPEQFRGGAAIDRQPGVELSASYGGVTHRWPGRVVRVEGAIDSLTRQLYVVAQVDDPYRQDPAGRPPLKIGQFVDASIQGRLLEQVLVLPRAAVSQDNRIYLIESGRLQAESVTPLWQDNQVVVVTDDRLVGQQLSLTPLGPTAEGGRVRVASVADVASAAQASR